MDDLKDRSEEVRSELWTALIGNDQSHKNLLARIEALEAENERLREALVRLRDCDWVITPLDRMDAVRDIARAALGDTQ